MNFIFYRGAVDESGEQFVAYFLPTEETLGKRKRDEEEQEDYVADDELVTSFNFLILHNCVLTTYSNLKTVSLISNLFHFIDESYF